MNETLVTLVGNAATGVEYRETVSGGMARFRFAVTPRRWDREKQSWADGRTSFYTVWAWRGLASNLSGSVSVGEPLVVHGRLKVREEEREGHRRTFVDIEAVAVGHDLTWGTAAFRRVMRGGTGCGVRTGGAEPGGADVSDDGVGRLDEPDWSSGASGRVSSAGPEGSESSVKSGGSAESEVRARSVGPAEPLGPGEQARREEGGERVERRRGRRSVSRQKGDQEPVLVP